MPSLILIRGLPGAGKSTLAKLLAGDKWPCYSIDDFFTDSKSNEYTFAYDKNHLAYKHCLANTEAAMKDKISKIFIHNTFTMDWEMEPYLKLANENGYKVFVTTVEKHHHNNNIHLVSDEQIKKMAKKYKVKLY